MVQIPDLRGKLHYRRESWLEIVPPGCNFKHKGNSPKELQFWIPDTHLKIADAENLFGQKRIEGWTGKESHARRADAEPDPPWDWYPAKVEINYFIISEQNEIIPSEETKALEWWSAILPTLVEEWLEEQRAFSRWQDCLNQMRNSLASGEIKSQVLSESGVFVDIPEEIWRGQKGGTFLRTGVAECHKKLSYYTPPVIGPVVLRRDFLEARDRQVLEDLADSSKQLIINPQRFPYLALMLDAASSDLFSSEQRVLKKEIEHWLLANWPSHLGEANPTKVSNMATFLRRPKDEKGGLHGKDRDN